MMNKKPTTSLYIRVALASAALIFCGALIAQAVGFVSFERGDTFVFWDDMKVLGGILVSGIQGEIPSPGSAIIEGRDIFVRGLLGFCPQYSPTSLVDELGCGLILGNLGNGFFAFADALSNDQPITVETGQGSILLHAGQGKRIQVGGQLINQNGNLIISNPSGGVGGAVNTVFANTVEADMITGSSGTVQLGGSSGVVDIQSSIVDTSTTPFKFLLKTQ